MLDFSSILYIVCHFSPNDVNRNWRRYCQGDLFHFLRELGRITQRLERRLEQVLKEETDAWDKWCTGRIYTPTLENTLAKVDR